jgi:hypothetical protein
MDEVYEWTWLQSKFTGSSPLFWVFGRPGWGKSSVVDWCRSRRYQSIDLDAFGFRAERWTLPPDLVTESVSTGAVIAGTGGNALQLAERLSSAYRLILLIPIVQPEVLVSGLRRADDDRAGNVLKWNTETLFSDDVKEIAPYLSECRFLHVPELHVPEAKQLSQLTSQLLSPYEAGRTVLSSDVGVIKDAGLTLYTAPRCYDAYEPEPFATGLTRPYVRRKIGQKIGLYRWLGEKDSNSFTSAFRLTKFAIESVDAHQAAIVTALRNAGVVIP